MEKIGDKRNNITMGILQHTVLDEDGNIITIIAHKGHCDAPIMSYLSIN